MADEEDRETSRIEAFSDGVFAIAITLLILEIKVPHDLVPGTLARGLVDQWPSWIAFLVSFATILIMWVNHHRLFTLIRRADDGLLLWNGLLLLFVTIVPVPTAVVAQYLRTPDAETAALFYNGNALMIALSYTWLWRHAAIGGRLLGGSISSHTGEDVFRQYRFGPALYVAALAASWFSAPAGLVMDVILALFFALPPAALRK